MSKPTLVLSSTLLTKILNSSGSNGRKNSSGHASQWTVASSPPCAKTADGDRAGAVSLPVLSSKSDLLQDEEAPPLTGINSRVSLSPSSSEQQQCASSPAALPACAGWLNQAMATTNNPTRGCTQLHAADRAT